MDNDYSQANSLGDNYVETNPYANSSNALKLSIGKVDGCQYYASFSYVVAAGGATVTCTPLTGNLGADLDYYRVEVSDGTTTVSNNLILTTPTVAFAVNTSTLDTGAAWTLEFFGSEGSDTGDAGCGLQYTHALGVIGVAGGSGNTIPASWVNVEFLLLLTSTDDANFTLFPTLGLPIADGESVDLADYLDGTTQFTNNASVIFSLDMRKREMQPSISIAPTVDDANSVFESFASTNSYPYGIEKQFVEVLNAITLETDLTAAETETMTFLLTDEGVKPSVSFTLSADTAAP